VIYVQYLPGVAACVSRLARSRPFLGQYAGAMRTNAERSSRCDGRTADAPIPDRIAIAFESRCFNICICTLPKSRRRSARRFNSSDLAASSRKAGSHFGGVRSADLEYCDPVNLPACTWRGLTVRWSARLVPVGAIEPRYRIGSKLATRVAQTVLAARAAIDRLHKSYTGCTHF
jgi:hypothetical protein